MPKHTETPKEEKNAPDGCIICPQTKEMVDVDDCYMCPAFNGCAGLEDDI